MLRSAILLVAVLAACGKDKVEVSAPPTGDYHHAELIDAIDDFVAAGRTPEAYGELAQTVSRLRSGMDRSVASEAELKLVVLAIQPVKGVQAKSMDKQVEALALTVFPTLLSPPIVADDPLLTRNQKGAELAPKPGEDPSAYLMRLCGGPLSSDCKRIVPELQGPFVRALAVRRATERARVAVSECLTCSSDPGWHDAVLAWESIDRASNAGVGELEHRADPDNWPIAGSASEEDPGLPEAELSTRGDVIVGGRSYGPNQLRIDVLTELRGDSDVIAIHFHPDTTLAQVRGVLLDARKAGAKRVAVIARESVYPYRRRVYWVADGTGMRANLRPTDSLQLLLHAIDEVAGPGTVARID